MRESLAWGGSWPLPIVVIIFIVEKSVKARGDCLRCVRRNFLFKSFISRCMTYSSSCLWDTWLPTREWLLLVWVVFTLPLPKPSILFVPAMLKVWEVTLLLGSGRLGLMGTCSMGVWSYHVRLLFSLAHKFFPQTAPIVGSAFGGSLLLSE